ncbi:MAG TPA: MOSC N-terminal beta barrel domain-containing protein [Pyrinomonadaceae bacterium]|nr:MOSC N-terminal beta barrel domain-containing protein [Pyrinomonadaceae bacterium]
MKLIGHVSQLVRYPIKSMAGTTIESAFLGWHGLDGDRRFAFRRLDDQSGFPWLSASRLPELILYHPFGIDETTNEPLPTHVRTPNGSQVELRSEALEHEIAERFGKPVELMQLKHGIFDDASVSVIGKTTIAAITNDAGVTADSRRFRANVLVEMLDPSPFAEDSWVGGRLVFGEDESGPAVSVTARDVRCMMINLDPDTAKQDAKVLKGVVRLNANNAGVYGTVVQTGTISVGQTVSLF